mgnify:CR=1 FL=1
MISLVRFSRLTASKPYKLHEKKVFEIQFDFLISAEKKCFYEEAAGFLYEQ